MDIKLAGSQPSATGPAEYFTGTVRIDELFKAPGPARVSGASVTFEPCARTAWHTHRLGQTSERQVRRERPGSLRAGKQALCWVRRAPLSRRGARESPRRTRSRPATVRTNEDTVALVRRLAVQIRHLGSN